jgi:predicted AlkP superfamily phosphohydrolase/phosphomutase
MKKTLLIGLDGATFSVLDPFMEGGVMPFLGELTTRGVRAPLRTIMPPLTPPAWTSLMTGKRPGQHGVFDFFQKEAPDTEYFRLSNSQDIHSATIWSLASDNGKRVISLNFPLMFPPPAVNGAVVPGGWMPWRQLRLGCHPTGLFDRLKTLPSFNPRELSLDMELEAKAIEGCPDDEYLEWIRLHTRREERWFEILRYLMAEDEPADLIAVMFDGVDKLQHLCWRFIDLACRPEHPSPWEREVIDCCEGYFRRLDAMIAEIVKLGGPDATVVLASDHGFGPTWDVLYINQWLEERGYLAWADSEGALAATSPAPQVGFAAMTRHVFELDWQRTLVYAATPSSQGLNIVRCEPGTDVPMPRERYEAVRTALADELRQIRHPVTGRQLVLDVVTREEAFAGPHEDLAPDLSLVLADGAAISILRSDTVVRQRTQPSGNHRWHGIFIAAGPSIARGESVDELSILDVAPVLLYTLDLPLPQDISGCLPTELFVAEELQRRPPRSMARSVAAPLDGRAVEDPRYRGEEEAVVVSRLRALGYLE